MAPLTDDMTRLCGEIEMMRRIRAALLGQLEDATRERRNAVSAMRADFAHTRAEMARTAKASRLTFVSGLKQAVAGQQHGLKKDVCGARRAWSGPTPARVRRDGTETAGACTRRNPSSREAGPREVSPRQAGPGEVSPREERTREKRRTHASKETIQGTERRDYGTPAKKGVKATNERGAARSNRGHDKGSDRRR